MLFLMKKQIAAVLTLGALLSVSHAQAWTPNKTQVGVAAGAALAYITQLHKVDNAQKDKGVVTKALDTSKETVSNVYHNKYARALAVLGAVAYVAHNHEAITNALKDIVNAAKS